MRKNKCWHCPEDMHGFVFCRDQWISFPCDTQKCKKCGQVIHLKHSKISHFMIIILTICLLLTSRFCLSFILRRWPDPYLFGGIGLASLLLVFLIWKRGAIFQHWRQAIVRVAQSVNTGDGSLIEPQTRIIRRTVPLLHVSGGGFVRCIDFFYDENGNPFAMRKYRDSTITSYGHTGDGSVCCL